jgi:plasmid replication initiation protein
MTENGTHELRLFDFETGPIIQVEVNLEEAPLFMFKRRARLEESIEAWNSIITREGNRLEQYWKITAHREFGLPGPLDQDVFVAVMTLVSRRGGMPLDGRVSFTLYELMEILGKTHAGNNYEDLRDSLDRLAETSIYAQNAFYSQEDEDFKSHRFHIWSVQFSRKKRRGRASEHHTLRFDDNLVRSYNASYLKSLDSDFYYALKKPLARSLYRLIDVKRKDNMSWTVDLDQLRQLVSMPPSYRYPSKIKRHLDPAHKELVKEGFLDRAEYDKRGKQQIVHYRVSPKFVRERARASVDLSDRERFAIERLVANRVWSDPARELVLKHGPEHCLHYVEALPYQEGVRDVGAWLRKYIENGWPVKGAEDHKELELRLPVEEFDVSPPRPERRPEPPEPDPDALELWMWILQHAAGETGAPSLKVWFEGTVPVALDGTTLSIWVPNSFAQEYIEARFKETLESSMRAKLGSDAHIVVRCASGPDSSPLPADVEEFAAEIERRKAAGEFDEAIKSFETLPYEQYRSFVGHDVKHLDGERFYLTIDGELYVYAGGRDSNCRHYLCTLER